MNVLEITAIHNRTQPRKINICVLALARCCRMCAIGVILVGVRLWIQCVLCVCLQACTTTLTQFSVIGGLRVDVRGVWGSAVGNACVVYVNADVM